MRDCPDACTQQTRVQSWTQNQSITIHTSSQSYPPLAPHLSKILQESILQPTLLVDLEKPEVSKRKKSRALQETPPCSSDDSMYWSSRLEPTINSSSDECMYWSSWIEPTIGGSCGARKGRSQPEKKSQEPIIETKAPQETSLCSSNDSMYWSSRLEPIISGSCGARTGKSQWAKIPFSQKVAF